MTSATNDPTRADGLRRYRRRLALAGILGLALLGAGGGYLAFFHWRTPPPPPPAVDLSDADPAVARALESAGAAVRRDPRSADAWGRLGMLLAAHGFYPESAPCFLEAERLDPTELRWPYFRGVVLAGGDPDAALPDLERTVELCGDQSEAPRLRLAELLLGQGRAEEAEGLFRQVLAGDPGDARAHLGLGRLARDRNNLADAQDHLERAAASPLTQKAAHTLLAEVRQRRGEPAAAAHEQHLAGDLPDDPEPPDRFLEELEKFQVGKQAHLARASKLLKQGRVGEALALLRETVGDYPESGPAWLGLGRALIQGGQCPAAERALRESVRLAPDLEKAHFYLGVSLFEQGDYRAAAVCFRRATELQPGDAVALYNLGHCLKRQGDRAGAVEAFRAAVRYKPHYTQAHTNLGELLAQDGRKAETLKHLRLAIGLDPADARARKLLEKLGKPR